MKHSYTEYSSLGAIPKQNIKGLKPKKSTIDFILGYSKALKCVKTKKEPLIFVMN